MNKKNQRGLERRGYREERKTQNQRTRNKGERLLQGRIEVAEFVEVKGEPHVPL